MSKINGVKLTIKYVAEGFTNFCFHVEDNEFVSVSHLEKGAGKALCVRSSRHRRDFEQFAYKNCSILTTLLDVNIYRETDLLWKGHSLKSLCIAELWSFLGLSQVFQTQAYFLQITSTAHPCPNRGAIIPRLGQLCLLLLDSIWVNNSESPG